MRNDILSTSPEVLQEWLALGEDVEYCPICCGDFLTACGWCRDCGYTPEVER